MGETHGKLRSALDKYILKRKQDNEKLQLCWCGLPWLSITPVAQPLTPLKSTACIIIVSSIQFALKHGK